MFNGDVIPTAAINSLNRMTFGPGQLKETKLSNAEHASDDQHDGLLTGTGALYLGVDAGVLSNHVDELGSWR